MFDALLLRLGRATAATMDVPAVLADVCRTLHPALGVRGVVVAAGRSVGPALGPVAGSDDTAAWIGRVQRDARSGPLAAVTRSGRPLLTADLLRIGPPELAAAAADAGITEAMTVPLTADAQTVGVLQLLGDPAHPAGPGHAEPLGAVLDVLAARLADVEELRRVAAGAGAGAAAAGPGAGAAAAAAEPACVETTAILPVARERADAPDERREPAPAADPADARPPLARRPPADRQDGHDRHDGPVPARRPAEEPPRPDRVPRHAEPSDGQPARAGAGRAPDGRPVQSRRSQPGDRQPAQLFADEVPAAPARPEPSDERRPDERHPDERRPDERRPDDRNTDGRRRDERRPDARRPDDRRSAGSGELPGVRFPGSNPDIEPATDRFPDLAAARADPTSVLSAVPPDRWEPPREGYPSRPNHPVDGQPPVRPNGQPVPADPPSDRMGPAPRPPSGLPPSPRPPGPTEMLVPVPRYHEPGAATFGAAVDPLVDGGTEAGPPPAVAGAGAPADGSTDGAVSGTTGPRQGRRRREP